LTELISNAFGEGGIGLAALSGVQYSAFMEYPEWLDNIVDFERTYSSMDYMDLALEIALCSASNGEGPFGTVIGNDQGSLLEIGWNRVVSTFDTTAHAEIVCLRAAQKKLRTYKLDQYKESPLSIYTSAAPCIQCFGAIYWSGVKNVYSGAPKSFPENIGFKEGPVSEILWEAARKDKEIHYRPNFFSSEKKVAQPFEEYKKKAGIIY